MTRPNLPPSAADEGRLLARVEQLERLFRNVALAAQQPAEGGDGAGLDLYRAEFQLEDPGEGNARLLFLPGAYNENGPGASIGNYLDPGDALNIDEPGIYAISLVFEVVDGADLDDGYTFAFFGGNLGEAGNGDFDHDGFAAEHQFFSKSPLRNQVHVSFTWTGWLAELANSITIVLTDHGSGVTSGNPTFDDGRFYIQRLG